ncbi:hypothetical protein VTK56DRAFT_1912 [Thermocarpiscus australiensis]
MALSREEKRQSEGRARRQKAPIQLATRSRNQETKRSRAVQSEGRAQGIIVEDFGCVSEAVCRLPKCNDWSCCCDAQPGARYRNPTGRCRLNVVVSRRLCCAWKRARNKWELKKTDRLSREEGCGIGIEAGVWLHNDFSLVEESPAEVQSLQCRDLFRSERSLPR